MPGVRFGEVQNLVHDREKGLPAATYRFDLLPLALIELRVQQQAGHADHRVHRRANLVTHVGEELALDGVGGHRFLPRLLELVVGALQRLSLLFAHQLGHLHGAQRAPTHEEETRRGDRKADDRHNIEGRRTVPTDGGRRSKPGAHDEDQRRGKPPWRKHHLRQGDQEQQEEVGHEALALQDHMGARAREAQHRHDQQHGMRAIHTELQAFQREPQPEHRGRRHDAEGGEDGARCWLEGELAGHAHEHEDAAHEWQEDRQHPMYEAFEVSVHVGLSTRRIRGRFRRLRGDAPFCRGERHRLMVSQLWRSGQPPSAFGGALDAAGIGSRAGSRELSEVHPALDLGLGRAKHTKQCPGVVLHSSRRRGRHHRGPAMRARSLIVGSGGGRCGEVTSGLVHGGSLSLK